MKKLISTLLLTLTLGACSHSNEPSDDDVQYVSNYGSSFNENVVQSNEVNTYTDRGNRLMIGYGYQLYYQLEGSSGYADVVVQILRSEVDGDNNPIGYEVIKEFVHYFDYDNRLKFGRSGFFEEFDTEQGKEYIYKISMTVDDFGNITKDGEKRALYIQVGGVEEKL